MCLKDEIICWRQEWYDEGMVDSIGELMLEYKGVLQVASMSEATRTWHAMRTLRFKATLYKIKVKIDTLHRRFLRIKKVRRVWRKFLS